jgi:aerobic C4-dicarboxylate transport protein
MALLRPLRHLYVQVLIGVALGVLVGALWPDVGEALKPLGDGFIRLIKMIIAPVIFCTVAAGIAHMTDFKSFGRLGAKTLIYFEVVSTLALIVGLAVGATLRPGVGFGMQVSAKDAAAAAEYAQKAENLSFIDFLLNIIPETFLGAFAEGNLLQVLLLAVLTGFACARLGEFGRKAAEGLDRGSKIFFSIIAIVVKIAPIGAFGAMAYTVGRFGLDSLVRLGALVGTFYLTSFLFVAVVLGLIARVSGFSLFKFLRYIRDELFIVLGASSSEAALPQLMEKLQRLGARKDVVGLVVPTGYSFNLDGTNIYMTLATLFLAQATGAHLTWEQMLLLLSVAMLTSKGASGVTGAGFITLAATLAVVPSIPVVSLAVIFGIDRFMSECRALTNFIGNGVATLVIAGWEKALDRDQLQAELDGRPPSPAIPALAGARAD